MNNKNQIKDWMENDKIIFHHKLDILKMLLENGIINSKEAREYLGIENKQK